jgi:hypothetical protein
VRLLVSRIASGDGAVAAAVTVLDDIAIVMIGIIIRAFTILS